MKQECQIVQDLLPLYEEKLASEGSISYIKAHCRTCENCKQIMARSMQLEDVVKENVNDSVHEEIKDMTKQNKYNGELNLKRAINKAKLKRGIRLYNIVFFIFLASYTVKNIYLIMNSPFMEADRAGYQVIYYSPRSAILRFALLVLIFIISNIFFYIINRKIMQGK